MVVTRRVVLVLAAGAVAALAYAAVRLAPGTLTACTPSDGPYATPPPWLRGQVLEAVRWQHATERLLAAVAEVEAEGVEA